jgi:hypothetical protein
LEQEAYAESRLLRNAVAQLKALSDTKIGRLDEACSTMPFLFVALTHPSAWKVNSLEVRVDVVLPCSVRPRSATHALVGVAGALDRGLAE